jgi:hypothetical protein
MSHSIVSGLASQWFDEYARLAYWLGKRWSRRLLDYRSRAYSASELEELAQDAVCRGYDRFVKRCYREVCGQSDRKRWVCQCVIKGPRDAVRSKSRFGSISSHVAVRDDVMNRCQRVNPGFAHGDDNEKQDALEQVGFVPINHVVQRWELEQLVERELPAHLRLTALYAACGLAQEQSAILQGVTTGRRQRDNALRIRLPCQYIARYGWFLAFRIASRARPDGVCRATRSRRQTDKQVPPEANRCALGECRQTKRNETSECRQRRSAHAWKCRQQLVSGFSGHLRQVATAAQTSAARKEPKP